MKPLCSVCALRIWKIRSCLRIPVAPSTFRSLPTCVSAWMPMSLRTAMFRLGRRGRARCRGRGGAWRRGSRAVRLGRCRLDVGLRRGLSRGCRFGSGAALAAFTVAAVRTIGLVGFPGTAVGGSTRPMTSRAAGHCFSDVSRRFLEFIGRRLCAGERIRNGGRVRSVDDQNEYRNGPPRCQERARPTRNGRRYFPTRCGTSRLFSLQTYSMSSPSAVRVNSCVTVQGRV